MSDFLKWFDDEYERLNEVYRLCPNQKPTKEDFKYIFLSDYIFDVTTYDDGLSLEFGKKIYEVMKSINESKTFDYIKDEYKTYILVCNLLNKHDLIDWGTSIRGAWWSDYENTYIQCYAGCWGADGTPIYDNPKIKIKNLLEWLEGSDK